MTLPNTVLSDRFGLLGAGGGLLAGLPPTVVAAYLILRLIIPVILIALATRTATPAQRINLVRAYLITHTKSARARASGGYVPEPISRRHPRHVKSDAPSGWRGRRGR